MITEVTNATTGHFFSVAGSKYHQEGTLGRFLGAQVHSWKVFGALGVSNPGAVGSLGFPRGPKISAEEEWRSSDSLERFNDSEPLGPAKNGVIYCITFGFATVASFLPPVEVF